ncbi:glycerophosphoryl diester phosphodiesterase [Pokkaliibacter sp. CJK22405]|uniref:glycerophosphoryl diester phosphodiesterase n=1 Tax=Pokkaliibacter sp. CJK22405 TaxID=3384615 RepID=UPI0039849D4B
MHVARVIGHRGAAALAPENTLASIREAKATGATWVEIDVSVLADGTLVIFHDETLERCTSGSGVLEQQFWSDIKDLDAGSWFDPRFADERIPTLEQALECIQSLGLGLNLEIKYEGHEYSRIVDPTLAALEAHWQDSDKLVISSFNHGTLLHAKALNCRFALGQLYEDIPKHWADELSAIGAFSLHCDHTHLTPELAQAIKAKGYQLFCYTSNEASEVAKHWAWGMDGIITDNPPCFLLAE